MVTESDCSASSLHNGLHPSHCCPDFGWRITAASSFLHSPLLIFLLITSGPHLQTLEKGLQPWQQHSTSGGTSPGTAGKDGSATVAQRQLGRDKQWVLGGPAQMRAKLHPKTPQLHSAMHRAEFLRGLCLQKDLEATKIRHRMEEKKLGSTASATQSPLFSL